MSDDASLGDLVAAYLAAQCAALIDAEQALRAREPEAVHDARVAARRLRSTFRTFAPTLDGTATSALEAELVWWAGLLGDVRDLDVIQARVLADLAQLPSVPAAVGQELAAELDARRATAWESVIAMLSSARYHALLTDLARWGSAAPMTERAEAPAAGVQRYVKHSTKQLQRRLARAVEAQRSAAPDADHRLHAARKAGKRARYAVELAAPVLGQQADRIIARRKDLQDVLGEYQDSVVAAGFLREQAARLGASDIACGLLYERELARQSSIGRQLGQFRVKDTA